MSEGEVQTSERRRGPNSRPSIFAQGKYSWPLVTLFSLLSFGLGIIALRVNPKAGIVPETSLLEKSSKLAWVREYKYGIRFGLTGTAENFEYPDKAGETGLVRATLEGLGDNTALTIRYEPKTHGPIFSTNAYHNVWELTVHNAKIRPYAAIAAAWEKDNRIGHWIGVIFSGCGIFLGYVAWQSFRRSAQCR